MESRGARVLPRRPWEGRRVVLGVTGGIAAYKTVQLARDLTRLGSVVDVVLTSGAQQFVKPLTFEALTGRAVLTDLFSAEGAARHIELGQGADAICVAPATADFLARAAQGRADDLLTTTLLASRSPVLLCPAMNDAMFAHVQTQKNLEYVRDDLGYGVLGPVAGPLAHGEGEGAGRMVEPAEIIEHIGRLLGSDATFRDKRVLITAGPTREAVDPVRYLGNRSSGRMGFALAGAAWRRGAEVTVVTGPTAQVLHDAIDVRKVETAEEMNDAVQSAAAEADLIVFAAAVSDFRPVDPAGHKLKKESGETPTIRTALNPDIASESVPARKAGAFVVGFALETDGLVEHARAKMERKGFDLIVANPAGEPDAGFESTTNRAVLLAPGGDPIDLPLMSKDRMAEEILDAVAGRWAR